METLDGMGYARDNLIEAFAVNQRGAHDRPGDVAFSEVPGSNPLVFDLGLLLALVGESAPML